MYYDSLSTRVSDIAIVLSRSPVEQHGGNEPELELGPVTGAKRLHKDDVQIIQSLATIHRALREIPRDSLAPVCANSSLSIDTGVKNATSLWQLRLS